MNFGRSAFNRSHKFNYSFTFKSFMTYNMKRNICFLNSLYKNKTNGVALMNKVQRMNYITVNNSATITNSISFLMNKCQANDCLAMLGNKMDSDFMTLLNEIFRLDEQVLENGSILRLLEESSMMSNSLRRSGLPNK